MTSSQDYYQPGMAGAGWWNPGRSSFPPCYTSVSDFMWLDSSLNNMDEKADQMKQGGSYSRSDDSSDDHHYSSSVDDQLLHVTSSDDVYAQTFQQVQNSQIADFNISDLLDYTNNSNNIHDFYIQEQLNSTAKEFQTSPFAYPATMQSLTGPDTIDMSYGFENSFVPNWPPKMLVSPSSKQHVTTNNNMPFWDSWMGNDEIDTIKSHQLQAHVVVEDQKPCKFGNPTNGISLDQLHKAGSNKENIIAQKLATCSKLLGTTKRKNSTSTTTDHGVYKRPRFETPSSLPTFKVRKEKLGDRITALQQLVSPFGKTDTASVLHEAIEYIKFLHDQVNVLRTPYTQSITTGTHTNQGELEGPKQDLKSHGLCLVSISSTFPLANETTSDFWTPAFGEGTFTFR